MHGGMMSGPMMPDATARSEEIDGGARIVVTPRDPSELTALREHARHMADQMASGQCPMMSEQGGAAGDAPSETNDHEGHHPQLRERNWTGLPFKASSLDAVVLTHAHIDHTGYLPEALQDRLLRQGLLQGGDPRPSADPFARFGIPAGRRREARQQVRVHTPSSCPTTLHTRGCRAFPRAAHAQALLRTVRPASGVSARLARAGHIVGSGCLALTLGDTTITFTGDVGRPLDPIMKPADPLGPTDFLVCESTYGDRRHPAEQVHDVLERVIRETVEKGGAIIAPAFAVGRAQHLKHIVAELKAAGRIPDLPVFLDSPMAISATGIFCEHKDDHRLSEDQCHIMCDGTQYSRTPEDSKAIDRRSGPMIVISASGMVTGGRILHHLRRFLPEERNTVLFVGYQATGTRGRSLVDGTDERKMHGQYVQVRARARVVQVQGLSAHADYREMVDWLEASKVSPRRVFVTHGEPASADAFRRRLRDSLGWDATVPEMGERLALD
jgi:metallo-beta-lactamase family protein